MNLIPNEEKDNIIQMAVEENRKFMEKTFDVVVEYFEEMDDMSAGCDCGKLVCPEMIASDCSGMPFVNESNIRLVLEAMVSEGYLKRELSEGLGVPHYKLKDE